MKKFFTLLFSLFAIALIAQPANDDCTGLVNLGVAPFCPDTVFFTNVGATPSVIATGSDNIPTCFNGGTVQRDVWFSFVASDTILDYTITVTGITDGNGSTAMNMPQVAIYRGDCEMDGLAELICASADVGNNEISIDVYGLTPGITYFLRINDYSTSAQPNAGTFQLCVSSIQPVNTIDEGGSTACFGELYDSGGPDSVYQANETYTYTICPTETHNCIVFTLDYYNIEPGTFGGGGDALVFYDGNTTSAPIIGQISGATSQNNGGGVCYMVTAASGCLTVQFTSDADVELDGFGGHWECTLENCPENPAISVDQTVTNTQIVASLSTPQTDVTIDTIICPGGAYGTFLAPDNSNLGLQKGLLLTTGSVQNAVGPNDLGSTSTSSFAPGDDDLDYLSQLQGNGSLSQDACILELDVFAATNELTFEYVFGSEEYPEYVGSNFNDIFAFLISGPGITGDPNIGNQEDIAVLPNSGTLVQINSVNNQTNWQYYRNNNNDGNFSGMSVEYDGLTSDSLGIKKSLTARKSVIPCNTYHLKLAIADRGDSAFDSGVFISDLKGGTPELEVQFLSGVEYLIENCTGNQDQLIIQLSNPLQDTTTYHVVIGGTATPNVDYFLDVPSTITFLPGQTSFAFPLFPITDNIDEGTETITISLTNNFGCGDVTYTTVTVNIEDEPKIIALNGQDTAFVCAGYSVPLSVEGAATYFWTPVNPLDDPSSSHPVCTPTQSGWFHVVGQVGLCTGEDSVYVNIIDPNITTFVSDPTICNGTTVTLTAIDNVGHSGLHWTPEQGLSNPNSATPTVTPPVTTTYTAAVSIAGCTVTNAVTVNVDEYIQPTLTTTDTLICQGYSVQLADAITGTTTQYQWAPALWLDDANTSGPLATPQQSVTYVLVTHSEHNYCADTSQVHITVVPALVDILGNDYYELCKGESITLHASTTTNGIGLGWTPNNGTLSSQTDTVVVATPTETTWYYTNLNVGQCSVYDSVLIRVDSLPITAITAIPAKPVYCPGEIVTLISPTFEPVNFPDISFEWTPSTYTQSPLDNFNLVTTPVETITYSRITSNRACADTTSFTIQIVDPSLPLNIEDTTICSGESVELVAGTADSYSWSPEVGLSCTDCNTVIAAPTSTTTYVVMSETSGCPASASATIHVIANPSVTIQADPTDSIPLGNSVVLTAVPPYNGVLYTWYHNNDSIGNVNPITVTPPDIDDATYQVFLVDTTYGCEGQAFITVPVKSPEYHIPSAFTPNGDSKNDKFNLILNNADNVELIEFQVYNRWGERVYNNEKPAEGWDGMYKNKDVPSDVYIYHIKMKLPNGEEVVLNGDVTLIR